MCLHVDVRPLHSSFKFLEAVLMICVMYPVAGREILYPHLWLGSLSWVYLDFIFHSGEL